MAEIKTVDPKTSVPSISVPSIGRVSPRDRGVSKARPQTSFSGEGVGYLERGMNQLSRSLSDLGKVLIVHERERAAVEASDRLADLTNDLNTRLANDVYPLRSGSAKDIFKESVALIQEGKEAFLELAGDDQALRKRLSIGYDIETQKHLNDVLKHKLSQDDVYKGDVEVKVAQTAQSEMAIIPLEDINGVFNVADKIDKQLVDRPDLAQLAKQAGFESVFKARARQDPEFTQNVYESPGIKKRIIAEVGSEGYDAIQAQIDVGRKIGIQDKALAKLRDKEAEDKHTEGIMTEGHTLYTQGKLNPGWIDALDIPFTHKRALDALLTRQIANAGREVVTDWHTYNQLSEMVNNPEQYDMTPDEVQLEVINAIGKTITDQQGKTFIDSFNKRERFKHPIIVDAYKELADMFANGKFEDYNDYGNHLGQLDAVVLRYNGDPVKVQEYLDKTLYPKIKKGAIRRFIETLPYTEIQPEYSTAYDVAPTGDYLLAGEESKINQYLIDNEQKDKDGKQVTYVRLTESGRRKLREYIRSQ